MRQRALAAFLVPLFAFAPSLARAQSTTYHLQAWNQVLTAYALTTTGPTMGAVMMTTVNLANAAPGEYSAGTWITTPGVPGIAGLIPAGSTITFTVWMSKTTHYATLYPRLKLTLNSATGTPICSTTGAAELTTSMTLYTLSCTTAGVITMAASDQIFLWGGVSMTAGAGGHSLMGYLGVDGTLNGKYDSQISVPNAVPPPPAITGLTPSAAPIGSSIIIAGSGFGTTQGTSTVTFNGVTATPTAWSATSITAPVPSGATTGPVVVTVAGAASNGVTFTVTPPPSITSLTPPSGPVNYPITIAGSSFGATQSTSTVTFNGVATTPTAWSATSITAPVPPGTTNGPVVVTVAGVASNGVAFTVVPPPAITSLTPASAHVGDTVTIAGNNFLATQGSSTVTFNGTAASPSAWSNTSITVPVPIGTTTGPVVVRVSGQASNGVTFTVVTAGQIAGTITRASDGTPLSGATVQGVLTGIVVQTRTSAGDGSYAMALDPGTYDVRVSATGFSNEVRGGVAVSGTNTTTVNVAMSHPGTAAGKVTQADGVTPISGAAVTMFNGPRAGGTANTDVNGNYTVSNLRPGSYTLQAVSIGYQMQEVPVSITDGATTTTNVTLGTAPAGSVTYVYDEINRLVSVVDASGRAANYNYDLVGNLLSVTRIGAGAVSISEFTPNGGPTGTTVTIFGTGFGPTPGQNSVSFAGGAGDRRIGNRHAVDGHRPVRGGDGDDLRDRAGRQRDERLAIHRHVRPARCADHQRLHPDNRHAGNGGQRERGEF